MSELSKERALMITIDGSFGEGGGQILRYSALFAAALGKPVRVFNIRANRPNPGLRAQHLSTLKIMLNLFKGTAEGLHIGSKEVTLKLEGPKGGKIEYDIGTAGSISLVLQTLIPATLLADSPSEIVLKGGTDVKWSPTIDYMSYVYKSIVEMVGGNVEINVIKRGYYPAGGGIVRVHVDPVSKIRPIRLIKRGAIQEVKVISTVSQLPAHILERQIEGALDELRMINLSKELIKTVTHYYSRTNSAGPGTSVLVTALHTGNVYSGGDAIGEKGVRAEEVGREASKKFIKWYTSNAVFDVFAGDMIIPYAVLSYENCTFSVPEITEHIKSALFVAKKFIDTLSYEIEEGDGRYKVISISF
ncbi:MAG: RNA 3'-terminal phosphate cyclase [Candidatus Geothermarchaeota archaeon]